MKIHITEEKLTFKEWKTMVNDNCAKWCDMVPIDLTNYRYRYYYDAGITPSIAAFRIIRMCLRNARQNCIVS